MFTAMIDMRMHMVADVTQRIPDPTVLLRETASLAESAHFSLSPLAAREAIRCVIPRKIKGKRSAVAVTVDTRQIAAHTRLPLKMKDTAAITAITTPEMMPVLLNL
jgi:hypothetical protein